MQSILLQQGVVAMPSVSLRVRVRNEVIRQRTKVNAMNKHAEMAVS